MIFTAALSRDCLCARLVLRPLAPRIPEMAKKPPTNKTSTAASLPPATGPLPLSTTIHWPPISVKPDLTCQVLEEDQIILIDVPAFHTEHTELNHEPNTLSHDLELSICR